MHDLFFFNPGCEIEVASGLPNYSLQKHPAMLEKDLSVLPMFLSAPGDYVVSDTRDRGFVDFWHDRYPCTFAGWGMQALRAESFGSYRPWGISPRALHLARGLQFSGQYTQSPVSHFSDAHRKLFSRETSVDFFRRLIPNNLVTSAMTTPSADMPVVARSVDEAADFFSNAASSRFHGTVFKAVFGSSGRGVRILRACRFTPNISSWVSSCIRAHGSLECEYLFDKVSDFSMHYDIRDGKAHFVGLSSFSTADTGAYLGSLVRKLDSIPELPGFPVSGLADMHLQALNDSIYTEIYQGPLGIDCMVYRDGGSLIVNPCVEINCRNSMGRLAMELSPIVDSGRMAHYYVYQKKWPLPGMEQRPVFSNGKLVSGFLPLTPGDTVMFAAGILIS